MAKWKIYKFGSPETTAVSLEVSPMNYSRSRQEEAVYEPLTTGGFCRVGAPIALKKEEIELSWPNLTLAQFQAVKNYVGQQVVIVDHLGESFTAYLEGILQQYLITGANEQRYAVKAKLREV